MNAAELLKLLPYVAEIVAPIVSSIVESTGRRAEEISAEEIVAAARRISNRPTEDLLAEGRGRVRPPE